MASAGFLNVTVRRSLEVIAFFSAPKSGWVILLTTKTLVAWSITSTANCLLLLVLFFSSASGRICALYFWSPTLEAFKVKLRVFEVSFSEKETLVL